LQQSQVAVDGATISLKPRGQVADRRALPGLHLTQQAEPLRRETLSHVLGFRKIDDNSCLDRVAAIQLLRLSSGPAKEALNPIGRDFDLNSICHLLSPRVSPTSLWNRSTNS
jgi:hypothetical protein